MDTPTPYHCKSPVTLAEQSQRVVVTLVLRATCYLRGRDKDEDVSNWISGGQEYLQQAPHNLLNKIILEVMKWKPSNLQMFLLPQLQVLEVSGTTLEEVVNANPSLPSLKELYLYIDISSFSRLERNLYRLVGSFHNLQKLKLFNCCTDNLLAVIGANCKLLQIFDAEDDSDQVVSDVGLSYLSNCKELTHVILNDTGDEFDYEDRYFEITERGVASLILALPKLQVFVCEPSVIRGALRFLSCICQDTTLQLRYLHFSALNNDMLNFVLPLTPNITTLVLEDPILTNISSLSNFQHLAKLSLKYFTWEVKYFAVFPQLYSLTLQNVHQMHIINESFIIQLGKSCQQLKELRMILHTRDAVEKTPLTTQTKENFFPKLTTLNLSGCMSTNLIQLLLSSCLELQHLSISFNALCNDTINLDCVLLLALKSQRLRNLLVVNIFQWNLHVETILCLIDQCPKLQHIWGLDLSMMCSSDISTFKERTRGCNLAVEIHYGNISEIPKCLQFLQQTSKRMPFVENVMSMKDWRVILSRC